jgi:hypothetical protein
MAIAESDDAKHQLQLTNCSAQKCHSGCAKLFHGALLQASRFVPTGFTNALDPVGANQAMRRRSGSR